MSPFPTRVFLPFLCVLRLASVAPGATADDFSVRVWETDDGVPHNGVNTVVQTQDGFLWLATQHGLARFDGMEFKRIRSPLLGDTRTWAIRGLIEERPNELLIANDLSGLLRVRDGRVTPDPLAAELPRGQRVVLLFHERPGVFWVIFYSRLVWRCHDGQVESFPAPATIGTYWPLSFAKSAEGTVYVARGAGVEAYADGKLTPVPGLPDQASTVCEASDGGIWIGTPTALSKLHEGVATVVEQPVPWPKDWPPNAMMEDRDHALWIGTKTQGLLRWENGQATTMRSSYPRINDLEQDDSGTIWVATAGGGLNRLQRARFTFLGEDRGVLPDIIGNVCEDAAGTIWFSNRNCIGRIIDGKLEVPDFPSEFLKKGGPICPDRAGRVWMAVGGRLCRWKAGTTEAPQWVPMDALGTIHALYAARDGSVWAGGDSGPVLRFQGDRVERFGPEEGFAGSHVQAIEEDANGRIWVGTERGELYQRRDGRFAGIERGPGEPGSGIRALHGDAEGNMWIGTGGAGLLVWHEGQLLDVTELDGLPDDTISQIVEDDFGALWLGSSRGLFKAAKSDLLASASHRRARLPIIIFGKSDGLTGFSATGNFQPGAWKARNGQLWFGTRKGLVTTAPDRQPPNQRGPRVYLEQVVADGQPVSLPHAQVSSSVKRLEFRYTAPIFTAPDKAQFRCKLEGFDSDWSEVGTQRFASYSHLPPGHYVFRVTAGNSDLVWNPTGTSLAFDVRPQWWETWWARGAGLALAAGGLMFIARAWSHRRLKAHLALLESRRRLELERTRIARDLHDSLGASLTQAGLLAEELCEDCHDLTEMKEGSSELANRVRIIARDLDAAVWAVSPKNDSLSSLCAYLCQFALEYFRESPTRCRVNTADDIPAEPLTPEVRHHLFLTAREAMNNVLKHAGAREVQLTLQMHGPVFEMWIEDDGHGFSTATAEAGERNGLRNMRARIAEIGGKLEIQSTGDGTAVRVSLALEAVHRKPPATEPAEPRPLPR